MYFQVWALYFAHPTSIGYKVAMLLLCMHSGALFYFFVSGDLSNYFVGLKDLKAGRELG